MSNFLRTEVEGNAGVVNLDLMMCAGVKKNMKYVEDSVYNVVAHMSSSELDGSGGSLMVEIIMFRGTESACNDYIDWLCDKLDATVYQPSDKTDTSFRDPLEGLDPVSRALLQIMRDNNANNQAVPFEVLLNGLRDELGNDFSYGGLLRSIVQEAVFVLLKKSLVIGTVQDERAHYLLPPVEQNDA